MVKAVKSAKFSRVVNIIIILWFLASFVLLVGMESGFHFGISEVNDFSFLIPKGLLIDDAWYGVYFKESLIGYSYFYIKVLDIDEGKGYLMKNRSKLSLPVLSTIENIRIDTETRLGEDYSLKEFNIKLSSRGYFIKEKIKRLSGNKFSIYSETPGRHEEKQITMPKEVVSSLYSPINFNYFPLKKRTSISLYEPFLKKDVRLHLENKGRTTVDIEGNIFQAHRLILDLEGSRAEIFTDDNGMLLKGEVLGFKFLKQEPHSLFTGIKEKPPGDLIFSFSIPSPAIPEKEKLRSLKIEIRGLSPDFDPRHLTFYNQKAAKEKESLILDIEKTAPQRILDIPINREVLQRFSIEERLAKEDSQKLREVAVSVVSEEENILKIVEKLHSWIDVNIEKIPTFSLFNSDDVLKLRQGDCTELSILLVGFLRSLGIPAYVNIGLVYQDGRFFYHAWPSVFIGEWIDTDPALSQLIADATHIKLLKGVENQTGLLKFLGGLKIEVLEARYD